jgi:hypothetical protein
MGIEKLLLVVPRAAQPSAAQPSAAHPRDMQCTAIARALPADHVVLIAREPTMGLAMCVRESPTVVIACADLGTMMVERFASLVEYAMSDAVPPFVVLGEDVEAKPPIASVLPGVNPDDVRRAVEDILATFPRRPR